MIGFGRPRRGNALDELKQRLALPALTHSEKLVCEFYEGRNPFEHLKEQWPIAYSNYVRGFAYGLEQCKKEGILDYHRREVIASTCGIGLARASFADRRAA